MNIETNLYSKEIRIHLSNLSNKTNFHTHKFNVSFDPIPRETLTIETPDGKIILHMTETQAKTLKEIL